MELLEELENLKMQVKKIESQQIDFQRQLSKKNIIIEGKAVPSPTSSFEENEEDRKELFCELVKRELDVKNVLPNEISVAHRVKSGGIVANFIHCEPNSTFEQILTKGRMKDGTRKSLYASLQKRAEDINLRRALGSTV